MGRHGYLVLAPAAALAALLPAAGQQDTELQPALALEKTVQKVIRENEPSVVCVLVSRSELYAHFDQGAPADRPGKLGAFDAEALRAHRLFGELAAADQKKLLQRLDLADPAHTPEL